eukprot:1427229-Rhodomonas_salina.5
MSGTDIGSQGIMLRRHYAMSGTDIGFGHRATHPLCDVRLSRYGVRGTDVGCAATTRNEESTRTWCGATCKSASCYQKRYSTPASTGRIPPSVRICYAMSGTSVGPASVLCIRYAMFGTDVAYAATRSQDASATLEDFRVRAERICLGDVRAIAMRCPPL